MSDINYHSSDWINVFNAAKAEINLCVCALTSTNISHEESIYLRGKIQALRAIIEKDKERFSKLSINPFK